MRFTPRLRHPASRLGIFLTFALASASLLWPSSGNALLKKKQVSSTLRWDESTPGCTFSRTADGRYQYEVSSDDLEITMTVDAQELEKVRRRHELFFGVLLTVQYRGAAAVDVSTENISLEFVKHFKVVQTSLDPDNFSQKIQNDADEFDHQIAREVQKHPEQKEVKEAYMRTFQKDAAELLEFVSKNTLKPARLDSANHAVSGWVLFSTDSMWIGAWKKQEEFVLRVPIEGRVFEFPFKLPPKQGELLLRQRE